MQRWKSHTCSIFRAPDYAGSAAGENSTPKSLHSITSEPHEETSVPAGPCAPTPTCRLASIDVQMTQEWTLREKWW